MLISVLFRWWMRNNLFLPAFSLPFSSQGGAVLDKIIQPHESHIPFLLQFLVSNVFLDQALVSNDTDNCNVVLKNHGLLLSSLFIGIHILILQVMLWYIHCLCTTPLDSIFPCGYSD
ncbi:hypothetical protein LguiA_007584 [Lonicera macranthoides]